MEWRKDISFLYVALKYYSEIVFV